MPVLGVFAVTFLGWLGFRTWDRQLARKRGGATGEIDALRDEVRRLQEQAGAAQDLEPRLAEVEERLDFAERMLTQRQQGELPRGGKG